MVCEYVQSASLIPFILALALNLAIDVAWLFPPSKHRRCMHLLIAVLAVIRLVTSIEARGRLSGIHLLEGEILHLTRVQGAPVVL
jgi:hypothetical protein